MAAISLLAVDIGNSNLKFGLHDGSRWLHYWPVATVRDKMPDEYAVMLRSFLREIDVPPNAIPKVVLSSVVPQLTDGISTMLTRQTGKPTLRVSVDLNLGIEVDTERPQDVGTDLLANAVAGYARAGGACIVVNFGTATTLSAVSDAGRLTGVSIAAGLQVTADALVGGAAQLAHVPLEVPPDVLGRNTRHAMQSGLVLGHLLQVEGLIRRIVAHHGPHKVVATGGLSGVFAPHTDAFDAVDPYLTLDGLRLIADRNP